MHNFEFPKNLIFCSQFHYPWSNFRVFINLSTKYLKGQSWYGTNILKLITKLLICPLN